MRELATPSGLREMITADFPAFTLESVELSAQSGVYGPRIIAEQRADVVLRYQSGPFFVKAVYTRAPRPDDGRVSAWVLRTPGESEGAPSLQGELDERDVAFVRGFVGQHPDGAYVYADATPLEDAPNIFEVMVETRVGGPADAGELEDFPEYYRYDPQRNVWSYVSEDDAFS